MTKKSWFCVCVTFLLLGYSLGSTGREYESKRSDGKPNIISDVIGAKILTDNDVEFVKILASDGKDVLYCDIDESLFLFEGEYKKSFLKKSNSSKCGKLLTEQGVKKVNGSGKLFGELFKMMKKDKNKESTEDDVKGEDVSKD